MVGVIGSGRGSKFENVVGVVESCRGSTKVVGGKKSGRGSVKSGRGSEQQC